jgi:hypothetical protein
VEEGKEERVVQEVELGQGKEEWTMEWRKERTEQEEKLSREEGL